MAEQVFKAVKHQEPVAVELPEYVQGDTTVRAAKIVGISTLTTPEGVKHRLALEGGVYVDVPKGWPGARSGSGVDGPRIGGYYGVDAAGESVYKLESPESYGYTAKVPAEEPASEESKSVAEPEPEPEPAV